MDAQNPDISFHVTMLKEELILQENIDSLINVEELETNPDSDAMCSDVLNQESAGCESSTSSLKALHLIYEGQEMQGDELAIGPEVLQQPSSSVSQTNEVSSRNACPSASQIERLVDFMETKRWLATGHARTAIARARMRREWKEIAGVLNNDPHGCKKTQERWSKYWRDKKGSVKRKVSEVAAFKRRAGDMAKEEPDLSDIEQRIMSLVSGKRLATGVTASLNKNVTPAIATNNNKDTTIVSGGSSKPENNFIIRRNVIPTINASNGGTSALSSVGSSQSGKIITVRRNMIPTITTSNGETTALSSEGSSQSGKIITVRRNMIPTINTSNCGTTALSSVGSSQSGKIITVRRNVIPTITTSSGTTALSTKGSSQSEKCITVRRNVIPSITTSDGGTTALSSEGSSQSEKFITVRRNVIPIITTSNGGTTALSSSQSKKFITVRRHVIPTVATFNGRTAALSSVGSSQSEKILTVPTTAVSELNSDGGDQLDSTIIEPNEPAAILEDGTLSDSTRSPPPHWDSQPGPASDEEMNSQIEMETQAVHSPTQSPEEVHFDEPQTHSGTGIRGQRSRGSALRGRGRGRGRGVVGLKPQRRKLQPSTRRSELATLADRFLAIEERRVGAERAAARAQVTLAGAVSHLARSWSQHAQALSTLVEEFVRNRNDTSLQ